MQERAVLTYVRVRVRMCLPTYACGLAIDGWAKTGWGGLAA